MISDAQLRFSSAQPIVSGTILSTNTLDVLTGRTNLGRARSGRILVAVSTPFAGGTSIAANFIQSDNADLSSPDVLVYGPAVPTASLSTGARVLEIGVPTNTKRYVGLQYVAVGGFTAGAVNAEIIADTHYNPLLPSSTGY